MTPKQKKSKQPLVVIFLAIGGLLIFGYWYFFQQRLNGGEFLALTFPRTCLQTITVAGGNSPRLYLRTIPGEIATSIEIDKKIKAESIDTAAFGPIPSVVTYMMKNKPLLWVKPDQIYMVLDRTYFSDFFIVDATRLKAGEEQKLGIVSKELLAELGAKDIASFLIRSEIIQTYVQQKADVCLVSEETASGMYRAEFDVIHTYHTNETNQEFYSFLLNMNAENGDVYVSAPSEL
ncbi:MAG TPA: hypothetical protein DCY48_02575 [Candidatus Magasanikbacteria bacterium]|nr:MAG: hypothetical protein A3I74_01490 [Candidatus Magasanikbacteria bacterium RIFCSPLOWO2_02_FULL_47_16]OGH79889.1 MAG: hypothetical protein A3C10_01735 [Candidatus Magasanikbacteria bacterium RIFCSPHIGHO2_02_FULL_48_18]OGH81865.1 MAG: hypothetical protein A3G08_03285 [Candidatus Magasanikbacteria bacterium RIFCSPLOWO2_12_FULL_47_9b]HAZ28638.1 hypothetical protein [Candidatus Magasanikbacteria bacterium]